LFTNFTHLGQQRLDMKTRVNSWPVNNVLRFLDIFIQWVKHFVYEWSLMERNGRKYGCTYIRLMNEETWTIFEYSAKIFDCLVINILSFARYTFIC